MKQYTYNIINECELKTCLFNEKLLKDSEKSKSLLVSIRLFENNKDDYDWIYSVIKEYLPKAVVIGQTTYGGISEGLPEDKSHTISILMFCNTEVAAEYYDYSADDDEYINGRLMRDTIGENADLVFFHVTAESIGVNRFTDGFMEKGLITAKIAGAGAGIPKDSAGASVACGNKFYGKGVIAVVLSGDDIDIHVECISGLVRVSQDFIATKAGGRVIYELDDKAAAKVYNENVGFLGDANYENKCLAFPLVKKRGEMELARVPVGITKNGGLEFAADVKEGEKYYIAYVDNRLHNENQKKVLRQISNFQPDAIMVYSCISRKGLIKGDVGLETLLFEGVADSSGYFTHGEILGDGKMINHKNSETLIISLREGEKDLKKSVDNIIDIDRNHDDMEGFHIRALLKCISNNIKQ